MKEFTEKDILEIKFDLGLCADSLMALFIGLIINEIIGIFYFAISLTVETISFTKKMIKQKRCTNDKVN